MAEHTVLFTRHLPDAVEGRAAKDYRLIANPEDRPLSADEIVSRSQEADAIVCCVADKMTAAVFSRLSQRVRIVASFGVGMEHLDLAAAKARGIVVTNTPGANSGAVADHALDRCDHRQRRPDRKSVV